jgi:hypothetical protein
VGRTNVSLTSPVEMQETAPFSGAFLGKMTVPLTPELTAALRGRQVKQIDLDQPWRDQKDPVTFSKTDAGLEVSLPGLSQARGLWEKAPPMLALTLDDGATIFVQTQAQTLRFDFSASARQNVQENLASQQQLLAFFQGRLQRAKDQIARPDDPALFTDRVKNASDNLTRAQQDADAGHPWAPSVLADMQTELAAAKAGQLDTARAIVTDSQNEIDKARAQIAIYEKTLAGPISDIRTVDIAHA